MNPEIAAEIQAEQEHGRQKYGNGPNDFAHDNRHAPAEWNQYIESHNEAACYESGMDWRQRMVKVAGLAVSAIEAFDRKGSR